MWSTTKQVLRFGPHGLRKAKPINWFGPKKLWKRLITNWGRFPDRRVMDFKIFTLEITGKKTGTKPRKIRALRRLVINLHWKTVIHKLNCRRSMIRFWKRANSIGFILNQTTRSLKDRASLLKSRRRRQGHMSNSSQEIVNSSPQLVFRGQRRILCLRFPRGTNIRRCNRLSMTNQKNLISDSSHWRLTFLVFIFTEEGSFLTPWCHRNQIRYFLTRSGKKDPMASFQRRNPGRNGSQIIRHRLLKVR